MKLSGSLSAWLLAATAIAQDAPVAPRVTPTSGVDRVLHDQRDADSPWAVGRNWKASFGRDGFQFVPFFGSEAPRNFPVRCTLQSVRVGGKAIEVAGAVAATRAAERYTYQRGAVKEIYDLALDHVEQTIVVDTAEPGDVEVVFAIASELVEDPSQPGIQFANSFGAVGYRDAFLLRGDERVPLEPTHVDGAITLRVPAAWRGAGPVVIDPIFYTQATTAGLPVINGWPDLAYDATNEAWLLAWEISWSFSDFDIYSQMFDRGGAVLLGSTRIVDSTTALCRHPRIANRRDVAKFLIVCDRTDPLVAGGRTMVYHMVRDAVPSGSTTALTMTSSAALTGPAFTPDVGGDSGDSSGSDFPVVWLQGNTGNAVYMRWVRPDGQLTPGAPAQIAFSSQPFAGLRISKTNGRDRLVTPMWLAVFSMRMSNQAHDIVALPISPTGAGAPFTIDWSASDDRNPSVSIPLTTSGTSPRFVVTCERQNPAQARAIVYEPVGQNILSNSDLTGIGIGPYWFRMQSDGTRFVCTSSPDAFTVEASTLAYLPATHSWVRQDGPHPMPGAPSNPSIASIAGGGGGLTEYGVAYIDQNIGTGRTVLMRFNGHADGWILSASNTGCNGLQLGWANMPYLGNTVSFPLGSFGSDLPVLAFGEPTNNPVPLCGTCQIGLRTDRPIQLFAGITQLDITIPPLVELVGFVFAVQGVAVGSGPCLGGLSLSDTWWMTVR